MMDDFLQTMYVVSHASFDLTDDALDCWEQLQESRICQGLDEIKEWFDMRELMEDHFAHCDDVEPSLFTLMKE